MDKQYTAPFWNIGMYEPGPLSNARFRITSDGQQRLARLLEKAELPHAVADSSTRWPEPNLKAIAFYSQFIKRGDLCFDIGANVGDRTSIFRKFGAKVIAVEPLPDSYRFLINRFANDENVTVLCNAIGEEQKTANLYVTNTACLTSLLENWASNDSSDPKYFKRVESTEMITLDSLLAEYGQPSFIKIDIEGYESQALKALSRPVNALSFEFLPHLIDNSIECIQLLSELGRIELNLSADESFGLDLVDWVVADEMIAILDDYRKSRFKYGDIYVKFVELS